MSLEPFADDDPFLPVNGHPRIDDHDSSAPGGPGALAVVVVIIAASCAPAAVYIAAQLLAGGLAS